jgi:ABC-type nitrate/sulfonate/bicarbonate transport system permease component
MCAAGDVGPTLAKHITATVFRICLGYGLGVLLGMSMGVLMQYNRIAHQLLDGIVETFRPVPTVAVVPFFILLFGFSETGKILVTVIGVGLMITVATVEAIERVPSAIIRWGLVMGLNRWKLFRFIILPAAWPEMRGGMRLAMALAITLVIVSEFMGATYGLGYLISVSKVTLTTSTLFLAIIILGWIGWAFDRLLRFIFNRTTAWDIRAKGATR